MTSEQLGLRLYKQCYTLNAFLTHTHTKWTLDGYEQIHLPIPAYSADFKFQVVTLFLLLGIGSFATFLALTEFEE